MICLAVFDPDAARRNILREWLVRYTVQQNCEMELLWFSGSDPASKIDKYAEAIRIALVSLDPDTGIEVGQRLYAGNPDCRILYYRSERCDMEKLLSTRPISFYLWTDGREAFLQKLDSVYREAVSDRSMFRYEAKSRMYLLPKGNILYFQSDLRYVNICLVHGENPRIQAKLSEMEGPAGDSFIRIHKSYLVNRMHIRGLDKKNHLLILENGEQLPVSGAQYEHVCENLRLMK